MRFVAVAAAVAMLAGSGPGTAQTAPGTEQDSLEVHLGSGSASVNAESQAMLDQAARLFRQGSPISVIVAGGADTVGAPDSNLALSIRRAEAVVDGLVARGIPAERLQLVGRGNSELAADTDAGVDSRKNRVVEITWR